MCVQSYAHTRTHTHARTHTHTHACACMHACTHTHTHARTHTHTQIITYVFHLSSMTIAFNKVTVGKVRQHIYICTYVRIYAIGTKFDGEKF